LGLTEAELTIFDLLTRPEPKLTAAQGIVVKATAYWLRVSLRPAFARKTLKSRHLALAA